MASSPTLLGGQDMTADLVGSPAWLPMAALYTNSWVDFAGGQVLGQYRLIKLQNVVYIVGTISHGSTSGNSAFATMPAGYLPASAQLAGQGEATSGAIVPIIISTAGVLTVVGLPAATTSLQFNGWYSLDA